MSSLGRRLGVLVLAGAALAGCMTGRSSLLATEGDRGGGVANAPDPPLTPIGGAYPVGPSRTLAASGNSARAAIAASSGSASARATAALAAPRVGTLRVSSALAANAGPVSTRAGAGVALTPTLAAASSVGASVAAVSQPLNLAASAQTRARAGVRTTVRAAVKVKTPVLAATVHVGG